MKMRRMLAVVLCLIMVLALAGCKSKAAQATEALIDAIGTVTAESEAAVKAAEDAFLALGEKERSQVENFQALEEAKSRLAVVRTEKLIDAIGEVTADSEAAVKAAEDALAALTDEQKSAVSNAGVLTEAREKLEAALEEARIEALRQQILGSWLYRLDLGPMLCEYLTENAQEYDLSLYDYLTTYEVAMILTLNDDGTYTFKSDQEMLADQNAGLHDSMLGFVRELVLRSAVQEAVSQGLLTETVDNWADFETVLGVDEDGFFELAYSMNKEDFTDYFIGLLQLDTFLKSLDMEGKYEFGEKQLLLNTDGSDEFSEDNAVEYTAEGDIMQWTGGTFTFEYPIDYTLIFQKQP